MNNLHVHQSQPRSQKGLTTTSPAIIDDKEQTSTWRPWHWRIPNLHIASAVRSLYFRLRGRTPVTLLKPSDNVNDVSTEQRSSTHRRNKVEPLTPVAFSTSSHNCLQPSISKKSSSVSSLSSSMSGIRDVSTPSRFSLPGAVGESEVFATDRTDNSQSNSDHLIYQHVGKSRDNDKAALDLASEANLKDSEIDKESTRNDRDIIHGGIEDMPSKDKVHHPVDIPAITHSPSSSPSSGTDSDVDIKIQDNDSNMDEVWQPRPFSRRGRECWEEQEPKTPSPVEGHLAEEEGMSIGSSVDFSKPDETDTAIPLVKSGEAPMEDFSELDEEIEYYEDNHGGQGDDYLDMDKVLRKCAPTEVLRNLRDMVQLSKNTTSQLEKALRRAARISRGPFPRLPGCGLTKTEIIDLKCAKLVGESEEFLGEMNKNFLTFYTVQEQMDKVSAQQDSFVSSILVKRGPCRDWRMGHAAIMRKMGKLWSRDYPLVITRKLKASIQETIYEEDGE